MTDIFAPLGGEQLLASPGSAFLVYAHLYCMTQCKLLKNFFMVILVFTCHQPHAFTHVLRLLHSRFYLVVSASRLPLPCHDNIFSSCAVHNFTHRP